MEDPGRLGMGGSVLGLYEGWDVEDEPLEGVNTYQRQDFRIVLAAVQEHQPTSHDQSKTYM